MVFGDEYNDIEMLKSVKYSFAMEHAKDGVKAAASYTAVRVEGVLRKLLPCSLPGKFLPPHTMPLPAVETAAPDSQEIC